MILVIPFTNQKEWQIFFSFTSKYLRKVIEAKAFSKTFFLFPSEIVELTKINRTTIFGLNMYTKEFFNNKNTGFLINPYESLLSDWIKNFKNNSEKIFFLKPTFFYTQETLLSLLRIANSRKAFYVYPFKITSLAECMQIAKNKYLPFYYFLNNEFNQASKKTRNEYIYLTNKFLFIQSREYHPIAFNVVNWKKKLNQRLKEEIARKKKLIQTNISKNRIYDLQISGPKSMISKIFIKINNLKRPYFKFYTSGCFKDSVLFQCIQKSKI